MKHTIELRCEVQLVTSSDSTATMYSVCYYDSDDEEIIGHECHNDLPVAAGVALSNILAARALKAVAG